MYFKEVNHSNIHLVLQLPREVELSNGIDLDNTNFKKGEPIELTHTTLEINPETLLKELKPYSFSGFISDIGTSTTTVAINPRQSEEATIEHFEKYQTKMENCNFTSQGQEFALTTADFDLIDKIEAAAKLISNMIHKEDRTEPEIQVSSSVSHFYL